MKAAKFVVGLVGAVGTALLGIYGPDTTVGRIVTVAVALATAVGVYLVPNAPVVTPPADGSVRRAY